MKIRKLTAILASFALIAAVVMSGCGDASSSDPASSANVDKTYTIGICQLVQHEALDAATKGFKDYLTEKLGDKVTFDEQNAAGESTNCSTIVNKFVSSNVDLIMANATGALQAAATATATIPIVGTSVTDYATALNISDWTGKTGKNITGSCDLAPLDQQAKMIKELKPDVKQVAILYCSAEANSKYQATEIAKTLDELGIKYKEFPFADSNDLATITQNAITECDAIYVPTDNTAASSTGIIDNIAAPAKIPVFAGEEGICKGCGVATLSISYYDIGKKAGELAYDILVNGTNAGDIDIAYSENLTKKYIKSRAESLGIAIPDDYEEIDTSAE